MRQHLGAVLPSMLAAVAVGAVGLGQAGLDAVHADRNSLVSSVEAAPLRGANAPGAIDGHYIVVLKASVSRSGTALDAAVDRAQDAGADVTREYGDALNGYAATMSDQELSSARHDPAVAYVVVDQRIRVTGSRVAASWGQDRIDSRTGLDGMVTTAGDGAGVTAYVIDTGVRAGRTDFGGRVAAGFSAISDGRGTGDCNGHGTHVAGTIGSSIYGVAPAVTIVPVRVLGCDGSGTTSGVIAGVDWVTAHHAAQSVANLSLGGSAFAALDNSVANSIASGVTYAVAAGNSNTDACLSSPARVPTAITVGASTKASAAASFSSWGSCVDLYAPGQEIVSDTNADTGSTVMSGTSMAAPHVTGAAALYLQAHPGATPAAVAAALTADATPGVLTGIRTGTVNKLLHVAPLAPVVSVPVTQPTTPAPTPAPTATPVPTPTSTPTIAPTPTPTITPTPTNPAVPACSTDLARRTLSARSDVIVGTPYTTSRAGTHFGCLIGPANANFDLVLARWDGRTWATVATGNAPGSRESVVYTGAAGQYCWQIVRISGSGGFTLRSGYTA